MEFSWPIFVTVVLVGAAQLAVGVIFGRFLAARAAPPPAHEDAESLCQLAGRLHQLVTKVAHEVGEHQNQIQQANQELVAAQSGDGTELTELVLSTVSQIVQVNQRLQARLSAAEEKLQEQAAQIQSHVAEARTDPLTRLPNRRAFDAELVCRIGEWQRRHAPFCLIMIDVDRFKKLNDQYGHLAGDQVLRRIAEVLLRVSREGDLVARVGGEEFAVVLPQADAATARQVAEALRGAVAAEPFVLDDARPRVAVSVGVAAIQAGDDPVSLVRRADEALYAAKRAGRNCGYFHDGLSCRRIPASDHPGNELQTICDDLRRKVDEITGHPGYVRGAD